MKDKVLFFHSSRCKLVLFSICLLAYGVMVAVLFASNGRRVAEDVGVITSLREDYYGGYFSIARTHTNLKNYVGYKNEDYFKLYKESSEELTKFITLLQNVQIGPQSNNLGRLCQCYLDEAEYIAKLKEQAKASDSAALERMEKADHLYSLVLTFAPYSINETEEYISAQIVLQNEVASEKQRHILILLAVVTVLLIGIVTLFVNYFLEPLERLTKLVREISTESWNISEAPTSRRDEMGLLYQTFYQMMNKNRMQYDELKKKQHLEIQLQKEREKTIQAEAMIAKTKLKVFQSQINSHFLFNTLNMISRLAYLEHAPQVQNASNLLARFLRAVLSQFNRIVTLEEEFEMTENYIEIQKLRFQDRIIFEENLDPDLADLKIPSVILQPLLENAIVHGVGSKSKGFVCYSAVLEGEDALLTVYDDGNGLSREQQKSLIEQLSEEDRDPKGDHGIGLSNVYSRLQLLYPGRVEPVLESCEGEFARIGFKIFDIYQESVLKEAVK